MLVVVFAAIVGLEIYARVGMQYLRTGDEAFVVNVRETHHLELARGLELDWLPANFTLSDSGFTTDWGPCDWDYPGETWLAFGDSTTRWVGEDPASEAVLNDPRSTWPALLAGMPVRRVQMCVFAETGYDPIDHAAFFTNVMHQWRPDAVVILLCANDLSDRPARKRFGWRRQFYTDAFPGQRAVFLPLYHPLLFEHLAMFRYAHWWLSGATGQRTWVHDPGNLPMSVASALRQIEGGTDRLSLWYVPRLVDGSAADDREQRLLQNDTRQLGDLVARSGLPIQTVELEAPLDQWRYEPLDTIHLNGSGHRQVAGQIAADLRIPPRADAPH